MFEFRDVEVVWKDTKPVEKVTMTVVIGDGKTIFDESFPYDDAVGFYFYDHAEYAQAWNFDFENCDFMIVGEVE